MLGTQLLVALDADRLPEAEEEPFADMAGHQRGISVRPPPSNALPDGTSWPLRNYFESGSRYLHRCQHGCKDRERQLHDQHPPMSRRQAGMPSKPHPIFPGSTWCRKLDTTLRGAIKQGLKMPRRTATQYLYLPQASGGLGVPSVEDVGHVTRAAQAFKFLGDTRDPIIRSVALHQLADTVAKRARRLDPTKLEDLSEFLNTTAAPGEGRAGDLHSLWSSARASLANTGAILELTSESAVLHANNHHLSWLQRKRAFQVLKEEMGARHLSTIKRSPDQGRAFDSLSLHPDSSYFTYSGAFLSFYQYRFVHKARLNLLPVRTVQARCRKLVPSTHCRHCGRAEETLAHILNHCHQHLGMVRERHNAVLDRIVRAVPTHLGTKMKEQAIPGTSGANRPDLTIISPDNSSIILVDVCCPFEGSPNALEDAARSKVDKYEPLRQVLLGRYASVEILPFIVGSLGSWYPPNDRVLSRFHIGWRYASLMRRLCVHPEAHAPEGCRANVTCSCMNHDCVHAILFPASLHTLHTFSSLCTHVHMPASITALNIKLLWKSELHIRQHQHQDASIKQSLNKLALFTLVYVYLFSV